MIYQKIQKENSCEKLKAAYDRILSKHSQRIKKYLNTSTTISNADMISKRMKLEIQFANTLFNNYNRNIGLAFGELQDIEPFLFVQLCSKASSMLRNIKQQRKRSLNPYYFSLQKKKQAKRDISQTKIKIVQANMFQEKQLYKIEQNLKKIINERFSSTSFFCKNFMKLFYQKVSIVRKICNARTQSKHEQSFKYYQRAQKVIEDIKTSKDYIIVDHLILRFRWAINDFIKKGTKLISFLGSQLIQLKDQSRETKIPQQQLFTMEVIFDGLQKARVKVLSSILEFLDSCVQRVSEYYENQFNNEIPIRQLSFLTSHFDSQVEYIACFVNKQLGSISKQFMSFKSFDPNTKNQLFQNRLELDNKQSQKLMNKIQNNFSRSYQYISKMFIHIKQVSLLQNLMVPMPQSNKPFQRGIFCNKKANKNKRIC